MEVKLFVQNNLEAVEKEVNEWLSAHPVSIRHITQSQSEKQGRFVFVISIFYEIAEINCQIGYRENEKKSA